MYKLAICVACAVALVGTQAPAPSFSPARLLSGGCPAIPIAAVSGGEVFLELAVDAGGQITGVTPLRVTAPFTDYVMEALRDWRFSPATDVGVIDPDAAQAGQPAPRVAVPSKVLVAAVFRPPTLVGPTLGELPKDVASGSAEVPVPISTSVPSFPPAAMWNGTVTLEVRVDRAGAISDVAVIDSSPPFDEPAIQAVREWRFRPARVHGEPVDSLAYVIFGFRVPVGDGGQSGDF